MGRSPSPRRRSDRDGRNERDALRERWGEQGRDKDLTPLTRRDERRDRDRGRHNKPRSRSRSNERRRRSPERRRSPSPFRRRNSSSPSTSKPKSRAKLKLDERPIITPQDLEGKTQEEQEMLKLMGFCGFDTTKGKKIEGNDVGEVHVVLKRKYRQYMNRKGGFNRPLDYVA